jgi:hypothetical protein
MDELKTYFDDESHQVKNCPFCGRLYTALTTTTTWNGGCPRNATTCAAPSAVSIPRNTERLSVPVVPKRRKGATERRLDLTPDFRRSCLMRTSYGL